MGVSAHRSEAPDASGHVGNNGFTLPSFCQRRDRDDGSTSTSRNSVPQAQASSGDDAGRSSGEAKGQLVSAGEALISRLKDPATDPQELRDIAKSALARKEFAGMLRARDERGRSPLHVAATRGDLGLCKEMVQADPGLVNQLDHNRNSPVMDAAFLGRAMIVKELVESAAEVALKNRDCMNALQLACVNEGAGNGDVIEALVHAGADPHEMCWQVTPLMAAADSGHIWAIQTLIDLGADPWQKNGSCMAALDYARDMESSNLLYDVMQGDRLAEGPAPRFDTKRLFKDAEARRARLHKAARELPLEAAFAELEVPESLLPDFRATGENFNEVRKSWHRMCLRCHPDKQPEGLEEEAAAEWTAQFQRAAAAFEAVERHYRLVCKDEELLPERPETAAA